MADPVGKDQAQLLETRVLSALGIDRSEAGEVYLLPGTTDKEAFVVNMPVGRLIITGMSIEEAGKKEPIWRILKKIAASDNGIEIGGIPESSATVDDKFWVAYKFICPEADQAFDWRIRTWSVEHVQAAARALADFHKHGASTMAAELAGRDTSALRAASQAEFWYLPVLNHGDFHPGNILFSKSKPVGIIDFAYACIDSPLLDLGYGALMFAADWTAVDRGSDGSGEEIEKVIDQSWAEQFVQSYCRQMFGGPDGLVDGRRIHAAMLKGCDYVIAWADTTRNEALARAGRKALKELSAGKTLS